MLSHGLDESIKWSHHTFFFTSAHLRFDKTMKLNLFFETDFDNSSRGNENPLLGWFRNLASGPRIDTCVYFLFK